MVCFRAHVRRSLNSLPLMALLRLSLCLYAAPCNAWFWHTLQLQGSFKSISTALDSGSSRAHLILPSLVSHASKLLNYAFDRSFLRLTCQFGGRDSQLTRRPYLRRIKVGFSVCSPRTDSDVALTHRQLESRCKVLLISGSSPARCDLMDLR